MEEEEVINSDGGLMWWGICVRKRVTKLAIELGLEGFRREYWVRKWMIGGAKEHHSRGPVDNEIWPRQA